MRDTCGKEEGWRKVGGPSESEPVGQEQGDLEQWGMDLELWGESRERQKLSTVSTQVLVKPQEWIR